MRTGSLVSRERQRTVDELAARAVAVVRIRPRRFRLIAALCILAALLLVACGDKGDTSRFGPVVSPVQGLVGVELTASRVVALPCIPSRSDPVGVWLGLEILDVVIGDDVFTLDVIETDARLGSHPSGCRDPEVLLAQSVFLVDGDVAILAHRESVLPEGSRLVFALDGRSPADLDVVILPTLGFEMGDGLRQTTIFGVIGRYSMA